MRLKKCNQAFWLLAALMLPALQGCVKDDLSQCPTTGTMDLTLGYTYHNKGEADLLPEEIKKVDFFVFDEAGTFVSRVTDATGPFVKGYHKSLELPGGNYRVVVWGNLTDEHRLSGLETGQVCLDRALLSLNTYTGKDGNEYVQTQPTDLFYAVTQGAVLNGEVRKDTLSFTKNTKHLTLNIRWRDQYGFYCIDGSHAAETHCYITGQNGDAYFRDNSLPRSRWVVFRPEYVVQRTVDASSSSTVRTTGVQAMGVQTSGVQTSGVQGRVVVDRPKPPGGEALVSADINVLRLMTYPNIESNDRIIITKTLDDGVEQVMYERSLVELINKTSAYGTQESLDREDTYVIDIDFRCNDPWHDTGDTWFTCGIYINGWTVVEMHPEV